MKENFDPKSYLTWLLKTGKLNQYDGDDKEEFAEQAQQAAEDEGLSLGDAERVYDAAFDL